MGGDVTVEIAALTSSADAARQVASGAGYSSGATNVNRLNPMFFIARATPPILPLWVV
jgi:hypothetical protein